MSDDAEVEVSEVVMCARYGEFEDLVQLADAGEVQPFAFSSPLLFLLLFWALKPHHSFAEPDGSRRVR